MKTNELLEVAQADTVGPSFLERVTSLTEYLLTQENERLIESLRERLVPQNVPRIPTEVVICDGRYHYLVFRLCGIMTTSLAIVCDGSADIEEVLAVSRCVLEEVDPNGLFSPVGEPRISAVAKRC